MRTIVCVSVLIFACLSSFQANPVSNTPLPHVDPQTGTPTSAPVTVAPTTSEPFSATVIEGGKEYHVTCLREGSMAHPGNVHKYIMCEYKADHQHWTVTVMPCAIGTRWHTAIHNCIADI